MHPPVTSKCHAWRRRFSAAGLKNVQSARFAFLIQRKTGRRRVFFVSASICLTIAFAGCRVIESDTASSGSNTAEAQNEHPDGSEKKITAITDALDRELQGLRNQVAQLSRTLEEKRTFVEYFEEQSAQARSIIDKAEMEWHGDAEISRRLGELHRLKRELAAMRDRFTTLLADDRDLRTIIVDLQRTDQKTNTIRKKAAYSLTRASYERAMNRLTELQLGSSEALGGLTSLTALHTQMKANMQSLQPLDTAIDIEIARLKAAITAFATPTPSASATPSPAVTSTPIILPTATPASTPAATPIVPQNALDAILGGMRWGNIAYQVQKKVPLHSESDATLVISPTKTRPQLEAEILGRLEQNPNIEARFALVRISETMRATLKATDPTALTIVPASQDGIQGVSFETDTKWIWKIRANQVGTYSLVFTLDAIVRINDQPIPYAVQTYSDTIEVNVSASDRIKDFIEKHWQFLLSTLTIPAAVFVYKLIKRRRGDRDADIDLP
ncbi:MAG: hypothetical protein V7609_3184 [Verrucomicrobiota bacterium]